MFFFDFDLDGRLDISGANGHLEEEINKVQESQFYEQAPQLFWNAGFDYDTEFIRMNEANLGEEFVKPLVGRKRQFFALTLTETRPTYNNEWPISTTF